jgi:hypothetical protein
MRSLSKPKNTRSAIALKTHNTGNAIANIRKANPITEEGNRELLTGNKKHSFAPV